MIYKKITVCILIGSAFLAHAINHEEAFLKGNKLYRQHEYAHALEQYQTIPHPGSVVWYNMGNAAYALNDFYDAALFWRKAERGATYAQMKDIAFNAKKLEQHIPDFKALQPTALPHNKVKQRLWPFSLCALQILMLVVWAVLMALLGTCIRGRRYVLLALLIMVNGLMAGVLYAKYCVQSARVGIVLKSTDLFAGPHKQYHAIASFARGTEVDVKEQRDSWYKVGRNHLVGWVFADTLSEI